MTTEDKLILEKRTESFPDFIDEMNPGIVELFKFIGIEKPENILGNLNFHLGVVDNFFCELEFAKLDRDKLIWLHTRLMFYIGELLIEVYGGFWFLQSDPESDFFLRYVLGDFTDCNHPDTIIDPSAIAYNIIYNKETLINEIRKLNLGDKL